MTTQDMLDLFDIIQDKYGSPYFEQSEKLILLNQAQQAILDEMFKFKGRDDGALVELDDNATSKIKTLIFEVDGLVMTNDGIITDSNIDTALTTAVGSPSAYRKILSIGFKKGNSRYPVKHLRHNNKEAFYDNYFKKPSYTNPRYTIQNNGIKIHPADTLATIFMSVVKYPKDISLVQNSEFPLFVHSEIVAIGLEFAGISSRDEALVQMKQTSLGR